MNRWLIAVCVLFGADMAQGDQANPYFHAIYCKAVWTSLSEADRASVAASDAAIAAIEKVLAGYVGSGAKTVREVEADMGDLKAYSNFDGGHLKDWKDCVRFYAP